MASDDQPRVMRDDAIPPVTTMPEAAVPSPWPAPATPTPEKPVRRGGCLLALGAAILGALLGAGLVAAVIVALWGVPGADTPGSGGGGVADITITPSDDIGFAEAVARKVTPSVVSVGVQQTGFDPFTGQSVTQTVGNGSGVIIRDDG